MGIQIIFSALATLAWVLFFGLIAIVVTRTQRRQPVRATSTGVIVMGAIAILASIASSSIVFIPAEERGVVVSAFAPGGLRQQILQPGLNWVIPFFEQVERYSISRQTYTMSIAPDEGQLQGDDSVTARTADGQEIYVDASLIYAIDPNKVIQLHIDWQDRYEDQLVRPLIRGVIRDAVSQYGVEQVVTTKRFELVQTITDELSAKMSDDGLMLADFILRNITFSVEYAASVEQKQIAEQLAQQASFVVEQRRQEAEQARQVAQGRADAAVIEAEGSAEARIIEATAEAEALQLIAAALRNNPDLLTYQYITRLAPGIEVMLVPNDNPFLLPLPSLNGPNSTNPN